MNTVLPQDRNHLQLALTLAQTQRGFCAPNPAVGAVIVDQYNQVIATGYHQGPGHSHAEVDALQKLDFNALGATLYVTLEPCSHWGKTPPCTSTILKSGIQRVVFAFHDPNPSVSGNGREVLEAKGIRCDQLSLPEINEFYTSYVHWLNTGKPYVTAKLALSLDGKIAKASGDPLVITGDSLREFTHCSRKKSDAILTTSKTILHDNPQMNVREENHTIAKTVYVLDSSLQLNSHANIFSTAKSITLFYSNEVAIDRAEALERQGVRCIAIDETPEGLDLSAVLTYIGQDGIHDLWVEAGGHCFSSFANHHLLQRALIYVAPRWFGEGMQAFSTALNFATGQCEWRQYGNDVLCDIRY